MSAKGGGCSSKGSSGKSRSGGGSTVSKVEKKMETQRDYVMTLRGAIYDAEGKDKDVIKAAGFIPALLNFKKSDIDATVKFYAAKNMPRALKDWSFELTKKNMKPRYTANGYAFDDHEEQGELLAKCGRFFVAHANDEAQTPIGFINFRFTVQVS